MENRFETIVADNPALNPLSDLVEQIMSVPEESLTEDTIEVISGMMLGAFTEKIRNDAITSVIEGFENEGYTRVDAKNAIETTKTEMNNFLDTLQASKMKRRLLDNVFNVFYEIFDQAVDHYHNYNIVLPIQLETGATMPTYAHDTDACADLYAMEDTTLPPHSLGNMIKTGVHIALPEGWMAMIFSRSSIGAKTPNRLSNSVGIIDTDYRGQLGVLYDNHSDSDYTFKAGDRIAQMLVMPVHRFKGEQVDILPATERGEGGFGSTGK